MLNRKATILVLVLAVILLMTPLFASCGGKAQPGQVLKVGVMTPSTGPVPEKGIPGQHGFADAVEYINKELNGVNGYSIQLEWRDSGYDMQRVGTIVQEFMDTGCVIFATHSSTEMKAASGKSNEAGFPAWPHSSPRLTCIRRPMSTGRRPITAMTGSRLPSTIWPTYGKARADRRWRWRG